MSWLKWYKSTACGQKQQEKWGDLTWIWNFLIPHETKSWILSTNFRCSLCPSSVLSSITHTYMIDNLLLMALAASGSSCSKKKWVVLECISNILVTNMLSFNNKHACLLVSCPSQNKHSECIMPGKKKNQTSYVHFKFCDDLCPLSLDRDAEQGLVQSACQIFFKCLFFHTAF